MDLLHHQVVLAVLQGVQVVVPVHAEAVAQVLVEAVVHRVAQHHVAVAVQVLVVVVVLLAAPRGVRALVVVVVLPVAPGNVPVLVELDAHQDVPDNVAVDVLRGAPVDVKQLALVTVLMVVIRFAVAVVIILAVERANMFQPVHLVPDAQEHVAPIVIAPVPWHVVPAVCHAA